jgi:hypothetical protein
MPDVLNEIPNIEELIGRISTTTDLPTMLRLLSTNGNGMRDSISPLPIFDSIPSPTINVSSLPTQIGAGGVFNLNVTINAPSLSYEVVWLDVNGNVVLSGGLGASSSVSTSTWLPQVTAPSQGTYYLEVGLQSTMLTYPAQSHRRHRIAVTVGPPLTATMNPPMSGGAGSLSASCSCNASGGTLYAGASYSFAWSAYDSMMNPVSVSPGFPNASSTGSQKFPATGGYTVKVAVSDSLTTLVPISSAVTIS